MCKREFSPDGAFHVLVRPTALCLRGELREPVLHQSHKSGQELKEDMIWRLKCQGGSQELSEQWILGEISEESLLRRQGGCWQRWAPALRTTSLRFPGHGARLDSSLTWSILSSRRRLTDSGPKPLHLSVLHTPSDDAVGWLGRGGGGVFTASEHTVGPEVVGHSGGGGTEECVLHPTWSPSLP